tara:strand:- start:17 stop:856 length:840 start_codon:yes stop_codon:yes gene_type:complete
MGYDLKKILITGASGYIGNFIYNKIKKTHKCIPLSRTKKKNFLNIDLLDQNKLKILSKNFSPSLIIHFANKLPSSNNFYENYKMTKNILINFKCPIIFLSSMTVYNSSKEKKLNEKIKIKLDKNKNSYAFYKLKTEKLIQERNIEGDLSIRIPGVFGGKRKSGLIHNVIYLLKKNKQPNINTFFGNWSAIHINHLSKLIIRIIKAKKKCKIKIINVAYKNMISIPIAITMISKLLKKKINITHSKKFKKIILIVKEYEKRYSPIKYNLRDGLKLALKDQ